MTKQFDTLWTNATLVTCEKNNELIEQGAIAVKNDKIAWLGKMNELSQSPDTLAEKVIDVQGRCLTPGLIDCHTHLIFGGHRAHEFALRLQGVSYEQIAQQGGGIQSTVQATREMAEDELFAVALTRAQALLNNGTTTIEIKSGYGLDTETELKMLRVAKRIEAALPITVSKTYLGAHTIPTEFRNNVDAYLDLVCDRMIPQIANEKLADAVDVFSEKIAFNIEQTQQVFAAAKKYGLGIKCHAEQLSASGSAALAASFHAWSVDHLEYASEASIQALGESATTAVLLPGAFYFLRETQLPPIDYLRKYHVPMALATDCNPGTSPLLSLLVVMNMACTLYRLTPEEALAGVTINAARALNMEKTHGSLLAGKFADFAIWNVKHPVELSYWLGAPLLHSVVKNGVTIRAT